MTIAVLTRVRGRHGELIAFPLGATPERLEKLERVFVFGDGRQLEIQSVWFHGGAPVFKFRGIDTIEDAEQLKGAEIRLPLEERRPAEPGEYFQDDLVGCDVIEASSGVSLGRVTGWREAGGPGLLEVGEDLLVPFARAICVEIDPAAKRIVVDLPEGLKDLNRS
ncbi:MAG: ribosome maturation factor RimM [Bryobacteraceae bacterium]